MKTLCLFNNKGGVGKTTLTYHLAHILAEPIENGGCGKRVLLIDLDPQSNLTIHAIKEAEIEKIWNEERSFIESGFADTKKGISAEEFSQIVSKPRTIHFLLKPTEEGISDETELPPPYSLNEANTLAIIPGRLTLYHYESVIAQRWSAAYLGEPLAIRTITKIKNIAEAYAKKYNYDYIIMDTSPSLGALNKVIISMSDGFIIPCKPDIFSIYGIKNIGDSLSFWKKEFDTMKALLQNDANKTKDFSKNFVNFLGYTIFNATRYERRARTSHNDLGLSQAHYANAEKFPKVIKESIKIKQPVPSQMANKPIGEKAIMYSHNTYTSQAQEYNVPIWRLCDTVHDPDKSRVQRGGDARKKYDEIKRYYLEFANSLLERVAYLDETPTAQNA
jgi:cellulose biosynthesis protein BcsQ